MTDRKGRSDRAVGIVVAGILALTLIGSVCKKPPVGDPPATPPAPTGITNGGYGTTYEYSTTTTDPDDDSIAFRFDWGDGESSDWSAWVASGSTASSSHSWPDPGTYEVKARAKDHNELTSDWSAPLVVNITTNLPPGVPAVPTGPSFTPKDSLCTFTTIASDPDGDGIGYRFDWGTGDTSDWTDWVPSGQPASVQYLFRRAGTREVRAQVRDANEAVSGWSNPLSVSIPNPNPPATPETPAGYMYGRPESTYTFWAGTTDPDSDSVCIRMSWGDGDTSDWSDLVPSGEEARFNHAWQDTGAFLVRAQARDEDDALSGWSDSMIVLLQAPPRLKWRFAAGAPILSSPAIASDGTVYVGSDDGYLYAISPDGSLKWRYPTGYEILSSPAIGVDGTVYVVSGLNLSAISPSGSLNWRFQFNRTEECSPAIAADGTIYVGSKARRLYAIGPDGTERWRFPVGERIASSPAVAVDGTIYFGSDDSSVYALNPDGSFKWRYETDGCVSSSPALGADGTIYVGSDDGYLYALDPSGAPQWNYYFSARAGAWSSPVIGADGTVYDGPGSSCLYAINPDGTLKWYNMQCFHISTPAVAMDGTIYVASEDLILALRSDGSRKWWLRTDYPTRLWWRSSPAVGPDGTIYIGAEDGYLYAIEGTAPLADSPWPKFRHDNSNTGRVGGP